MLTERTPLAGASSFPGSGDQSGSTPEKRPRGNPPSQRQAREHRAFRGTGKPISRNRLQNRCDSAGTADKAELHACAGRDECCCRRPRILAWTGGSGVRSRGRVRESHVWNGSGECIFRRTSSQLVVSTRVLEPHLMHCADKATARDPRNLRVKVRGMESGSPLQLEWPAGSACLARGIGRCRGRTWRGWSRGLSGRRCGGSLWCGGAGESVVNECPQTKSARCLSARRCGGSLWCFRARGSVGNECPQTKSAEPSTWESMPVGVRGLLTQAVPQITASPPSAGTLYKWTPDGGVDLVRSDSGRSSRLDHPKSEINECPQTKSAEPSTRESMPAGVRGLVTTGSRRGRQTRSIGVRRWSRSRSTGLRTVESTGPSEVRDQ